MPYDEANGQFFTTLGTSDLAPDNVYTTKRDGVWYSRDFGASWTLTPITEGWVFWSGGKARVSIADPDVVWAGYGLDSSPDRRLHVSKDQGVSFEAVALPTMNQAPETVISGLATHPTESGTAYALFSRYGYPRRFWKRRTTDRPGLTFQALMPREQARTAFPMWPYTTWW